MSVQSPAQLRIQQAAIELFSERGSSQITVQELAKHAGVARGTIYNNIDSIEQLFHSLTAGLADEMHSRIESSHGFVEDPAEGLAREIRFFVRRAHEEPAWGWFVFRFGLSADALRGLFEGVPARALEKGLRKGRYEFRPELTKGALTLIGGATLSAMFMVLEGRQTWREAGSSAAELLLRAFGVPPDEAQRIAELDLPPLVSLPNPST